MTLEIRPADEPERFDLYDGDDRIGEIRRGELTEEDTAEGEPPYWEFTIWSVMGTGKEWGGHSQSYDEVVEWAREEYEEFLAERRELSKGSATWTTSSIPMGGKPGWRRR
ncbi:hypothetical protein OIE75_29970 [Streptomyces sp. NBC_01723]|uniref:hypothetical protein n=1 Tax=Streptomyces sp. NBC_01723 TaxID=2975921 RepID=UPI002E336A40|nr:hypothetical protein [Streptomyces sp. NBC_01723]